MFWHPLLLAIFCAQIVALVLVLTAGLTAFRTALHWQPHVPDSRQLALEAQVAAASIQGRAAYGLWLFAAFLLVFGIANLFHHSIPGAMCGTGVFQAMSGSGSKLLLYLGVVLLLTHLWYALDRLNGLQVDLPLTARNARLFLTLPPVALLTLIQTYQTFAAIVPYQPVDCCAVVYDQFHDLQQAESIIGLGDPWWLGVFLVLSLLLLSLGAANGFTTSDRPKTRLALAAVGTLWLPVAALTLVNILSAYHYGVLQHHCPWCLFLPEHGLVGYPLYGAMVVIAMEGFTLFFLPPMAGKAFQSNRQVTKRCRQAAQRITFAGGTFLIITLGPPLFWRLRYGVWMSG